MIQTKLKTTGFTLIELMLAMAFIGMLLIATVVTIMQVTNQYSKGMTLKQINQAGRDLGASIKRDATSVTGIGTPIILPDAVHTGNLGRLCLGAYSYVWSTPAVLQNGTATEYNDTVGKKIVMARVADAGGALCQKINVSGDYSTTVKLADSTEMLPTDNGDYAIHSLSFKTIPDSAVTASARLYDITYTIGTNQQGTINSVVSGSEKCELTNQSTNNYNFCAVNNFEIMVQVGY